MTSPVSTVSSPQDGLTKNGSPLACEPRYKTTKRILVTGGAGFLGSHLVERLLKLGHEVICVDNYFSGSRENVKQFLSNPNFEAIRHDVTDPLKMEVDQIYHLACPAAPGHYQYNAVKTLQTSVIGTMNMLEAAARCNARILLASTSEVYGDPLVSPQPETYFGNVNCNGIRSCYDEGKRAAESLMMDYHRQRNVDVRIARIFNTYGPRMFFGDGRVVSNFIVQCMRKQPITVYGEGNQTRSFCYVDDLISGLIALMEQDGTCGPVNIGNPKEFTVMELASLVQEKISPDIPIVFKPLPLDDPKQRCPDITLAKQYLGWEPTVQLSEGLDKTIAEFTQREKGATKALSA